LLFCDSVRQREKEREREKKKEEERERLLRVYVLNAGADFVTPHPPTSISSEVSTPVPSMSSPIDKTS